MSSTPSDHNALLLSESESDVKELESDVRSESIANREDAFSSHTNLFIQAKSLFPSAMSFIHSGIVESYSAREAAPGRCREKRFYLEV